MTKQFDLPSNCIFNTERDNIKKIKKKFIIMQEIDV